MSSERVREQQGGAQAAGTLRGARDAATQMTVAMIERQRAWILRARLRVLAYLAAITTAAVATITVIGAPWLPVVSVAVAAVAVTVSKVARGLSHPTCLACGVNLSGQPVGVHGITCPSCGGVTTPLRRDGVQNT